MTIRIEHMPSVHWQRVSVVTLETDHERSLTDTGLMRICGNLLGIEYVQNLGYRLTEGAYGGEAYGPLPPLGGEVVRSGNVATVRIFTAV